MAGKKMDMTSLQSWIKKLHFVEDMIYQWFVSYQALPGAQHPRVGFQCSSIARNTREDEAEPGAAGQHAAPSGLDGRADLLQSISPEVGGEEGTPGVSKARVN